MNPRDARNERALSRRPRISCAEVRNSKNKNRTRTKVVDHQSVVHPKKSKDTYGFRQGLNHKPIRMNMFGQCGRRSKGKKRKEKSTHGLRTAKRHNKYPTPGRRGGPAEIVFDPDGDKPQTYSISFSPLLNVCSMNV